MSSCFQTLSDYGLRSIGYGERLLPKADITLCEQFVLIGSGMIWNCLLYTSPSPRDLWISRMPSSA